MSAPLFRWREAMWQQGPEGPHTRHVLLVLSTFADSETLEWAPGLKAIMDRTGLARAAVIRHLKLAEEGGWIRVGLGPKVRGGRLHSYTLTIPERGSRAEPGSPAEPGSREKRKRFTPEPKEVHAVNPYSSDSSDSSSTEGEASASRNWTAEAVEVWNDRMGGTISHGRVGKALKSIVAEHGPDEVLRVLAVYLSSHLEGGRGQFASVNDLASKFGLYQSGKHRNANGRGYQDPAANEDYEALAAKQEARR